MSIIIFTHLESGRIDDYGDNTKDHDERCHALKDGFSKSHAFLIDLGASNHKVSSRESFSSLQLTNGLSIHMGDDTQIQAEGKGSIKLKNRFFKDVLYVLNFSCKFFICIPDDTYCPTKRVVFGTDLV